MSEQMPQRNESMAMMREAHAQKEVDAKKHNEVFGFGSL